jgi:hypothetical protein
LDVGSTVVCAHGGHAQPLGEGARVSVLGRPAVTQSTPYALVGCTRPPAQGGPCLTAAYVTAATRVASLGVPLLLADSIGICSPSGSPLVTTTTQARVTAS